MSRVSGFAVLFSLNVSVQRAIRQHKIAYRILNAIPMVTLLLWVVPALVVDSQFCVNFRCCSCL